MTPEELAEGRDRICTRLRGLADHYEKNLDNPSEEEKANYMKMHAEVLFIMAASSPPEMVMQVIMQTTAKATMEGPQTLQKIKTIIEKANVNPTKLNEAYSKEFIEDLEVLIRLEKGEFGEPGDMTTDKKQEVATLLVQSIERTMFRLASGLDLEEFVTLIRKVFVRQEIDLFLCTGELVPIVRDLVKNSEEAKEIEKKVVSEELKDAADFFKRGGLN